MNDSKKDFFDIAAELDGLSAILGIISQPYLEGGGADRETTGNAFFGLSKYTEYIAKSASEIAEADFQDRHKAKA